MELTQDQTEIDQATWDEVTAADDAAVSLSGADDAPGGDPGAGAEGARPADAAATQQPAADDPAQQPQDDPYAGLPDPVRNALAAIPVLEQRLRSAEGRVAALQREKAQATQPAPTTEAPRNSKLDALRNELPEVAEALQEVMQTRGPDPEQLRTELRAELQAELQEELLVERRPNWAKEVTSDAFNAWLLTQPAEDQQRVRGTRRASDLLGALAKFDAHVAEQQRRQQGQQRSERRLAAAVTPSSGARRAPAKSEDDMDPDELWDHITR